jgi:hypothetical protein
MQPKRSTKKAEAAAGWFRPDDRGVHVAALECVARAVAPRVRINQRPQADMPGARRADTPQSDGMEALTDRDKVSA